jgi:hypothetical protein
MSCMAKWRNECGAVVEVDNGSMSVFDRASVYGLHVPNVGVRVIHLARV